MRRLSRRSAIPLACAAVTLAAALLYLAIFGTAFEDGESMNVAGFTRLLIPDTFLYRDLVGEDLVLGFAIAGVKNALGPVLLWLAADGSWQLVAVMNAGFLLAALFYTRALCRHLGVPARTTRAVLLLLGLMPVMAFHSIGALKELPTLAALTGFAFHWLRGDRVRWILLALVLALFRYQFLVVIGAFALIDRYSRNPVRTAAVALLLVSAAYPFFADIELVAGDATAVFREDAEGRGGGALVEQIRESVPGLSAVAVAIRVVQSVLEPLLAPSAVEDGAWSVLSLTYLVSLLMTLPSWCRLLWRMVRAVRARRLREDVASLHTLILLFVVPVAGFSFVHHRYLFPVTALVLIAGARLAGGSTVSRRPGGAARYLSGPEPPPGIHGTARPPRSA